MIYTSYLANAKNIPDSIDKIFIARFAPRFLKMRYRTDMKWYPALSPSHQLLVRKKENTITWEEFKKEFIAETELSPEFRDAYNKVINSKKDVCLLCFEKDNLYCHRSIIAEMLKADGYEVEEYTKEK